MKEILGQTLSGRNTGDLLPQVVFSPVIYHDPRQEFKHPPSEVRSQKRGLLSVICLPDPRHELDKKSFIFHCSGVCWKMGCQGSGKVEKGRGLGPWERVEPDPGARMQGQAVSKHMQGFCRGQDGQTGGEAASDGPSSQQEPLGRAGQCTPGPFASGFT